MPEPLLFLRLEGPLQSWGVRSRWDVRDTGAEPSKSGVIGLIGCALGLPRGDAMLLELHEKLRFGVRVEQPGRIVTDYQTITDYLPTAGGAFKMGGSKTASTLEAARKNGEPATVISPRDYLEDAAFLVGFEAKNRGTELLQRAALALQNPRWPLFLGRKCCVPTRPIFEALTEEFETLEAALRLYPWGVCGAQDKLRKAPTRPLEAWLETDDLNAPRVVSRQDAASRGAARVFDFRLAVPLETIIPANLSEVRATP